MRESYLHALTRAGDQLLAAIAAHERDRNELSLLAVLEARQPFADALTALKHAEVPAGLEVWNEETGRVDPPLGLRAFRDAAGFEVVPTGRQRHDAPLFDTCGAPDAVALASK